MFVKNIIKICSLLIVLMFIVTGCEKFNLDSKNAITPEEFKNKMEIKGYIVEDSTNEFSEQDNVNKVYYAKNEEKKYQIEYFQFSDKKIAIDFFETSEAIIEQYKSLNYYNVATINLINYSVYELNSNGNYGIVSRVDNTVIRSLTISKYGSEINIVLYDLGYMENIEEIFDSPIFTIICLSITLIFISSMWLIFVKAGEYGWKVLIPFYNCYTLTKIAFGNGWKMLWLFVPVINAFFAISFFFKLAKVYGKSILFGLGLFLLWPIFLPILAFGKSQYKGYE